MERLQPRLQPMEAKGVRPDPALPAPAGPTVARRRGAAAVVPRGLRGSLAKTEDRPQTTCGALVRGARRGQWPKTLTSRVDGRPLRRGGGASVLFGPVSYSTLCAYLSPCLIHTRTHTHAHAHICERTLNSLIAGVHSKPS